MRTSEIFENELKMIDSKAIREIVADTLDASPECFKTIPASSSGKYHPTYSLGEGGLIRHTKAVVVIATCLMESDVFKDMIIGYDNENPFVNLQPYKDIVISACILHDCCKADDDNEKHTTRFDHPLLAKELFLSIANPRRKDLCLSDHILINAIADCIASHMGKWTESKYMPDVTLPKPMNELENYVHMADYLASRKFIEIDFDKV